MRRSCSSHGRWYFHYAMNDCIAGWTVAQMAWHTLVTDPVSHTEPPVWGMRCGVDRGTMLVWDTDRMRLVQISRPRTTIYWTRTRTQ
jgi:hypothetical protein